MGRQRIKKGDEGLKFPRAKTDSMKSVRAKADKWFSRFVRLRGTTEAMIRGRRYGLCVTSNKYCHITSLDTGHWLSRRHDAIRWNEKNAHCQRKCDNRYRQGEQYLMGRYIDKKYGEGTTKELHIASKLTRPYHKFEIEAIAQQYKTKCALLLGVEKMTEKVWKECLK